MSQGVNVCLLWMFGTSTAHQNLTVSARCHVEGYIHGRFFWWYLRKMINAVFFWQDDHCAESFAVDVQFAEMVKEICPTSDETYT
jgi:hypothetical protein